MLRHIVQISRRHLWLYVTGLLLSGYGLYMFYHLFYGAGNLMALRRLLHEVEGAGIMVGELTRQREKLEAEVKLLRPDGLSSEMLEEKARQVLKMADERDVVIIFPAEER